MYTYSVRYWMDSSFRADWLSLNEAKRLCRAMGHTDDHNSKWYAPVCYVADAHGFCVYNPRFKYPEEATQWKK